jgi:hypothetical protein
MGMIIASCGNTLYGKTYWVSGMQGQDRPFADSKEPLGLF